MRKLLLSTGNQYILNACNCAKMNLATTGKHPAMGGIIEVKEDGRHELYGQNFIGEALMEVREWARKKREEKKAKRAAEAAEAEEADEA